MKAEKPIFSPTSISEFERCKWRYWTIIERGLDLAPKLEERPTLGTFVHVLQAAWETQHDPEQALALEVKRIKTGPFYNVRGYASLEQLRQEALQIFAGGSVIGSDGKVKAFAGYAQWRRTYPFDVVDVEVRLCTDLGPVIAVPKLDLVVRSVEERELWVAEWKLTERDDAEWRNRWRMDGQTTLQVLAAEAHYARPVKGLLILPVLISRKRAKDSQSSRSVVGRPLCRIERPEPRWVPKNSETLRRNYIERLAALAREYRWRRATKTWPTTGMDSRQCDDCRMAGICSGQESLKRLSRRPESDLDRLRKGKQS